jgi:hypothetical protein
VNLAVYWDRVRSRESGCGQRIPDAPGTLLGAVIAVRDDGDRSES